MADFLKSNKGQSYEKGLLLIGFSRQYGPDRAHPDLLRESLFSEGFRRMGWEPYNPAMIIRDDNGKPVWRSEAPYYFNYSDTGFWSAAVFASSPVGIDLEGPRRVPAALVKRLPQAERAFLYEAEDDKARQERFIRLWTLKEAFCKMTGSGITKALMETSFSELLSQMKPPLQTDLTSAGERMEDGIRAEDQVQSEILNVNFRAVQARCGTCMLTLCVQAECTFDVAFLPFVR